MMGVGFGKACGETNVPGSSGRWHKVKSAGNEPRSGLGVLWTDSRIHGR